MEIHDGNILGHHHQRWNVGSRAGVASIVVDLVVLRQKLLHVIFILVFHVGSVTLLAIIVDNSMVVFSRANVVTSFVDGGMGLIVNMR
jgi:hypothetical protein